MREPKRLGINVEVFGGHESLDEISEEMDVRSWKFQSCILLSNVLEVSSLHGDPPFELLVLSDLVEVLVIVLLEAPKDSLKDHIWPVPKDSQSPEEAFLVFGEVLSHQVIFETFSFIVV